MVIYLHFCWGMKGSFQQDLTSLKPFFRDQYSVYSIDKLIKVRPLS